MGPGTPSTKDQPSPSVGSVWCSLFERCNGANGEVGSGQRRKMRRSSVASNGSSAIVLLLSPLGSASGKRSRSSKARNTASSTRTFFSSRDWNRWRPRRTGLLSKSRCWQLRWPSSSKLPRRPTRRLLRVQPSTHLPCPPISWSVDMTPFQI